MQGGTASAHKLLEALILKALVNGSQVQSSTALWLPDLLADLPEKYAEKFNELNMDLVVEVKLTWDFPEVSPWDEE